MHPVPGTSLPPSTNVWENPTRATYIVLVPLRWHNWLYSIAQKCCLLHPSQQHLLLPYLNPSLSCVHPVGGSGAGTVLVVVLADNMAGPRAPNPLEHFSVVIIIRLVHPINLLDWCRWCGIYCFAYEIGCIVFMLVLGFPLSLNRVMEMHFLVGVFYFLLCCLSGILPLILA